VSDKPSQWQIVLGMLQTAGENGVHSVDIRREYIANPSQRIIELENRGHAIRAVPEKSPYGPSFGKRYFLAGVSGVASTPVKDTDGADSKTAEAAPETPVLFDLQRTPFDPFGEAA
jgi:hypothetical protein